MSISDIEESTPNLETAEDEADPSYQLLNHGVLTVFHIELDKKNADLQGVFYHERNRDYIAIDANGLLQLKPQSPNRPIERLAKYPNYEYNILDELIYYKKYNMYFALRKDSSLTVLDRFFVDVVPIDFEQRNILLMIFDKARDQLITNGAYGIKFWRLQPREIKSLSQSASKSNFELLLLEHKEDLGGSWVKFVHIDNVHDHLYLCSDLDVYCYSLRESRVGQLVFQLPRCHRAEITGCLYSNTLETLLTSSMDTEVRLWHTRHGYLGCLAGHSRGVTAMHFYGGDDTMALTASTDGSVRLWLLRCWQCALCVQPLQGDPIDWCGLGDRLQLFVCSRRQFAVLQLSYLPRLWADCASQPLRLQLATASGKSTRVLAACADGSLRLLRQSDGCLLSCLLPPPDELPLQLPVAQCYARGLGLAYVLLPSDQLWVYFAHSNPACRLQALRTDEMQRRMRSSQPPLSIQTLELLKSHSCVDSLTGPKQPAKCLSDECPPTERFVALGLQDGRVLFVDALAPWRLCAQLTAQRHPVTLLWYDAEHQCLVAGGQRKGVLTLRVWSLPCLRLQHEVHVPDSCSRLARCAGRLVTGHASGHVICSPLIGQSAPPPASAKRLLAALPRPEHAAAVTALHAQPDSCLLLSADAAGHVRIWRLLRTRRLLAEVHLAEPVTAGCFLNDSCDLLLAMRRQLFVLRHKRYLPKSLWQHSEESEDDGAGPAGDRTNSTAEQLNFCDGSPPTVKCELNLCA